MIMAATQKINEPKSNAINHSPSTNQKNSLDNRDRATNPHLLHPFRRTVVCRLSTFLYVHLMPFPKRIH